MPRDGHTPHPALHIPAQPFATVEEAWFWFVEAQQAQMDGAQVRAGRALVPRPCEPVDIVRTVDRLYRQRRMLRDHLTVLVHFGRRHLAPEPQRPAEAQAAEVWREAMERLAPALRAKGIVQ